MPPEKMTVQAKAHTATPDSANRPKTKVAGSIKKHTRMQRAFSDEKASAAVKKVA